MINYIIAILFFLSVSFTTIGILLSIHLRNTYKNEVFTTLIFFQVFYFSFGFYAIWGQFFVNSFLSPYFTPELLHRITDLLVLFGMPFLAVNTIMLVRFSRGTTGLEMNRAFLMGLIFLHLILIFSIGYVFVKFEHISTFTVVKFFYIGINFLFSVYCSIILISRQKKHSGLQFFDRRTLSIALLSFTIVQGIILLLYKEEIFPALLFLLVYFITGSFFPVYLRYYADLSVFLPKNEQSDAFVLFCEKFEISKRETEIIHEICKGLSNQQIADKLFISLQTVKDHTHRIYFKTDCNSRAQLISKVNEGDI